MIEKPKTKLMVLPLAPNMPSGRSIWIGSPFSFNVTPGVPFEVEAKKADRLFFAVPGMEMVNPKDTPKRKPEEEIPSPPSNCKNCQG